MLYATRGIVFHTVRYAETSLIAKLYTSQFGLRSYLIKGVHTPRSRFKPALFQPLSLLELVVYNKERNSLQTIKEVQLNHPYQSVHLDIRKSAIALFICELAYKAIREEEPNRELFDFLWNSCIELDQAEGPVSHYHLVFALRLMHHLGIYPQRNLTPQTTIFNLREGVFQANIPGHTNYLDEADSVLFHQLLSVPDDAGAAFLKVILSPRKRDQILETILLYYKLHLPGFRDLQSHHILHTVLS